MGHSCHFFCQLNCSLLCCVAFTHTTATSLQHELQHGHATLFFTTQSAFLTLPRQGLFLRGSKSLNMEQGRFTLKLQRCVAVLQFVLQLCCSCVAVQVHATQQDTFHWHESFWQLCPTKVPTVVLGSHHPHLAKKQDPQNQAKNCAAETLPPRFFFTHSTSSTL